MRKNLVAWILKFFGLVLMSSSAADFFGFLPLPKTGVIPPAWQLAIAFAFGIYLLITPIPTLQGYYNKLINKEIDKA